MHLNQTLELLRKAEGDVFPAFAFGVYFKGRTQFEYSHCGPGSLFDLASLTKVLSTTTLFAIAVDKKVISVENPIAEFFPKFKNKKVLLSHLLEHSSGFPAWLDLHSKYHEGVIAPARVRAAFEDEILKSWSASDFEKKAVYSDLGFMLLGWALEKACNSTLDALFQEWVAKRCGFTHLQFLPTTPDIVPTEDCPWRKRVLRGEVHDDNCFVLGGVAGHAGLFGNPQEVIALSKIWLDLLKNRKPKNPLFSPETARKFWQRSTIPDSVRSLGWDGIAKENSSAGKYFGENARGHLGFTGTSLWIDPDKDLAVTLLTNRVHPTRTNEKIKSFRPIFHDTLLIELGLT